MPIERVDHAGRRTAYRTRGADGEEVPIVFVHGAGASHAVWRAQFRLARLRPVAAVDLSGHGESEDVDAEPGWETTEAYTSDVVAVVEEVDAGFVVGHSLGGAIAIHLAATRARRVDAIAVIGIGRRMPVHEEMLRLCESDFDALISFLHKRDRLFHDPDEGTLDASRAAMIGCGQAVALRDFLTADRLDLRADLGRVDVPVLALCGEHDRITPVHVHENLVELLPSARLEVIEEAAHMPMLERPAAVNDALSTFFE